MVKFRIVETGEQTKKTRHRYNTDEERQEATRLQRKARYNPEKRRARYELEREKESIKRKSDRVTCPLCGLHFRRDCLKSHMVSRHHITEIPEDVIENLPIITILQAENNYEAALSRFKQIHKV